jgi:hypothetical protein
MCKLPTSRFERPRRSIHLTAVLLAAAVAAGVLSHTVQAQDLGLQDEREDVRVVRPRVPYPVRCVHMCATH